MKNTMVAYFSATGVTRKVAERLAELADADLYEIEPVIPYTAADLNWNDKNSRSSKEENDPSMRPEIRPLDVQINDYTTIYLGFPIWWGVAPRVVNTFLESFKFEGDTIIPFATSGGSDLGDAAKQLQAASDPYADWKEGAILNHPTDEQLKEFIDANK